jgi:hypothetical protein
LRARRPEYGKVCRGVVLAVAGQILVEDDVERPMQAVFDCPMRTDDAQNILGTVGLAHQEEALGGFVLAALAGDPGNGLDPGKSCFCAMSLTGATRQCAFPCAHDRHPWWWSLSFPCALLRQ